MSAAIARPTSIKITIHQRPPKPIPNPSIMSSSRCMSCWPQESTRPRMRDGHQVARGSPADSCPTRPGRGPCPRLPVASRTHSVNSARIARAMAIECRMVFDANFEASTHAPTPRIPRLAFTSAAGRCSSPPPRRPATSDIVLPLWRDISPFSTSSRMTSIAASDGRHRHDSTAYASCRYGRG